MMRKSFYIAWGLFVLSLLAAVGAVILGSQNAAVLDLERGFQARPTDVVWLASWLGFPAVGALIVSRRPRNAVGWLLCGVGVNATIAVLIPTYARHALVAHPGQLPGGEVAAWLGTWMANPAAFVPFLVFLFPTGRVESKRWRAVVRAAVVSVGALLVWRAFAPGPIDGVRGVAEIHNPLGITSATGVAPLITLVLASLLVACAFASIAHVLWRFHTDHGVERQQIRGFAFSALLLPVTAAATIPLDPAIVPLFGEMLQARAMGSETGNWGFPIAFFVSFHGMAVSIGVAILRYRLYEIDRIINRTLSYALLTAMLGTAFFGTAIGLQIFTRPLFKGDDIAVAISTLAVTAAFVPLRRRVQTFVDRRFNRARYDAARTIERFGSRLRQEIDLETLGVELESVVAETMQPTRLSLWLAGDRP